MQTSTNSRYVFLMRHAKAVSASVYDEDHARPLQEVGQQAAQRVGRFWRAHFPVPEYVWCSDAVRTQQTAAQVQQAMDLNLSVELRPDLYMATASEMLSVLQQTPASASSVLMVGHNPGTHRLAHWLADDASLEEHDALHHHYPTGTLCVFRVPPNVMQWQDINAQSLVLEAMVMPKKIQD